MNIFGIGAPELIIIFILMLIFAGPKRMIQWAYVMGQYVAKFRKIWAETVDMLQSELDDAGVGIQLPKEPPTRGNMAKWSASALSSVTEPIEEVMDEVKSDVTGLKKDLDELDPKKLMATGTTTPSPGTVEKPETTVDFGTWSKPDDAKKVEGEVASASNDNGANLGSWSGDGNTN